MGRTTVLLAAAERLRERRASRRVLLELGDAAIEPGSARAAWSCAAAGSRCTARSRADAASASSTAARSSAFRWCRCCAATCAPGPPPPASRSREDELERAFRASGGHPSVFAALARRAPLHARAEALEERALARARARSSRASTRELAHPELAKLWDWLAPRGRATVDEMRRATGASKGALDRLSLAGPVSRTLGASAEIAASCEPLPAPPARLAASQRRGLGVAREAARAARPRRSPGPGADRGGSRARRSASAEPGARARARPSARRAGREARVQLDHRRAGARLPSASRKTNASTPHGPREARRGRRARQRECSRAQLASQRLPERPRRRRAELAAVAEGYTAAASSTCSSVPSTLHVRAGCRSRAAPRGRSTRSSQGSTRQPPLARRRGSFAAQRLGVEPARRGPRAGRARSCRSRGFSTKRSREPRRPARDRRLDPTPDGVGRAELLGRERERRLGELAGERVRARAPRRARTPCRARAPPPRAPRRRARAPRARASARPPRVASQGTSRRRESQNSNAGAPGVARRTRRRARSQGGAAGPTARAPRREQRRPQPGRRAHPRVRRHARPALALLRAQVREQRRRGAHALGRRARGRLSCVARAPRTCSISASRRAPRRGAPRRGSSAPWRATPRAGTEPTRCRPRPRSRPRARAAPSHSAASATWRCSSACTRSDTRALASSPRAPEALGVEQREVEVRLLERQAHRGEERERTARMRGDRGHVLPEVVGERLVAELLAVRAQALEVHAAVSLLVGQREREPAAQLGRQLRPAQQRPGEQLHGHQLVVREAAQTGGARARVAELARAAAAARRRSASRAPARARAARRRARAPAASSGRSAPSAPNGGASFASSSPEPRISRQSVAQGGSRSGPSRASRLQLARAIR